MLKVSGYGHFESGKKCLLERMPPEYFYDPSLTHREGGQGVNMASYLDSSHKVSQYLLIHCKTLKARIKVGGGEFDLLSRLSTYGFLLPPNTFYCSKCKT